MMKACTLTVFALTNADQGRTGCPGGRHRHLGTPTWGAPAPAQGAKADAILAELVSERGAPTLEHYRRVYRSIGVDWPGADEIRRLYPVADTAFAG